MVSGVPNQANTSGSEQSIYDYQLWPVIFSHTLDINKLWTLYKDWYNNKTSQSFWKVANHVCEAEDVLTTKEITIIP